MPSRWAPSDPISASRSSSSRPIGCTGSCASSSRSRGSSRARSGRRRRSSPSPRGSGGRGTPSACRGVPFDLADDAAGWLAIADPDQLDQVLWALLDNSARYAGGAAIHAHVAPRRGRGPPLGDHRRRRARAFGRRIATGSSSATSAGAAGAGAEGTGLGLYVSRSLCRAMGGDLVLEPAGTGGTGAAFTDPPARRAARGLSCPGSPPRGSTTGCCPSEPMAR